MKSQGRIEILSANTAQDLLDPTILAAVLNTAKQKHEINKSDIDYLMNYYKGIQPILNKVKPVRSEINNKIVLNHAQMITRLINGYFLGSPIQYVQNGKSNNQELVDELNRCVKYEDKSTVDMEVGEYQSVVGTAYRIIYTDGEFSDDVPFEDRSLDPSTTFVVYENSVSKKPLMGVTYYDIYDNENKLIGTKYHVYTELGQYTIMSNESDQIHPENIPEISRYSVGGVPIIEYPNNQFRIGDWELYMYIMDAINALHSGRFDDLDQIVQSLLVFLNADVDPTTYDEMREKGIIMIKNTNGSTTDIKNISNPLDQTGVGAYSQELEELLYALVGIPSRNNRAGGGGDTGQAVELRDGWADLEIIARKKEALFRKSEKRTLKIILSAFNLNNPESLELKDIDIKFSRNKSNNLLVKTQGYSTLIATKTLSPTDCLTIVDLVSDENEFMSRGESFWGDQFAGNTPEPTVEEVATNTTQSQETPIV